MINERIHCRRKVPAAAAAATATGSANLPAKRCPRGGGAPFAAHFLFPLFSRRTLTDCSPSCVIGSDTKSSV